MSLTCFRKIFGIKIIPLRLQQFRMFRLLSCLMLCIPNVCRNLIISFEKSIKSIKKKRKKNYKISLLLLISGYHFHTSPKSSKIDHFLLNIMVGTRGNELKKKEFHLAMFSRTITHQLGKWTQNQALMENIGSILPPIHSYELGSSTSKPQSTVISMWLY